MIPINEVQNYSMHPKIFISCLYNELTVLFRSVSIHALLGFLVRNLFKACVHFSSILN